MKNDQQNLFVYGSLREGFNHDAHAYISKYFSYICKGRIRGILSDMGNFPAATPTATENFIVGELYAVKNEDEFNWAIEQLDEYEGLFPEEEEGEKALFRRELTTIFAEDGTTHEAWMYWYNHDVAGRPVITSGDILQYIKDKFKP